jgi:ATP-dependent RNA helicase DHX36
LPEILRADLQSTCLSVKIQGHEDKVEDFLAGALEPPAPQAVKASLQSLKDLGALTPEETVTPLGRILGSIPVHPALGKMIVLGIIFRCLDPMIILGATTSNHHIFNQPHEMITQADDSKRGFTKRSNSDHIAVLKAFNALRALLPVTKSGPTKLMREFAREKFLSMRSFHAIHDAAKKIEDVLVDHGMILDTRSEDLPQAVRQYGGDNWNQNSEDMELVKAVLLSGLYPNVARKLLRGGRYQHPSSGKTTLTFHPSSMNNPRNRPWASGEEYAPELVAFGELRLTGMNELTMRDTTEITALMAILFGGAASRDPIEADQIVMDTWLPLRVVIQNSTNDETAVQTVLDFYKTVKIMKEYAFDTFSLGKDPAENEIFDLLVRVLRVLLLKEQDLNRYTQRYEFEFMRSLKSGEPWNISATTNDEVWAVKPDNTNLGPRIKYHGYRHSSYEGGSSR